MTHTDTIPSEVDDLLAALAERRQFLTLTAQHLTDEQARLTPTVSELSIGGLIKHVTAVETMWLDFVEHGAEVQPEVDWDAVDRGAVPPEVAERFRTGFVMLPEENLAGLLAGYREAADRTERTVRGLESLDLAHELPKAPWFEPGAVWTARRVLTQLIGETAQHAGHADIIRESIDGQKSMG